MFLKVIVSPTLAGETFWSSPMVLTSFYKQVLKPPATVEREQKIWVQLIKEKERKEKLSEYHILPGLLF